MQYASYYKKIPSFFFGTLLIVYLIGSYPTNYYCMKYDLLGYDKVKATQRYNEVGNTDRFPALLLSPISLPIIILADFIDNLTKSTLDQEIIKAKDNFS